MKHPKEGILALYAGGDLGRFRRWRTERHLARCERCRGEVAAFEGMREVLPGLAELPEPRWQELASEMKANIRLGLAAGECVQTGARSLRETPLFTRARVAVAMASLMLLLVSGLVLEQPRPRPQVLTAEDRTVLEHTSDGIQVGKGGQAFRLMNAPAVDARSVMFSVNAQGSMGARYVDPDSGYVTINAVYAQ